MLGLSKNVHYGKLEYWEKRYVQLLTDPFDWYQTYDKLKDIITQYIHKESQILNAGCGNSTLSMDMFQQGYKNITNIDFSAILIDDLQSKYRNFQPSFKFQQMDVRSMEFEDESFDFIIDKGLLDSVLCGTYSSQNCKKAFKEISRCLKSKGIYMCITYGQPQIRMPYFDNPEYQWALLPNSPHKVFKPSIDHKQVQFSEEREKNKDLYHYIYVLQKHAQIHSPVSQKRMSNVYKY